LNRKIRILGATGFVLLGSLLCKATPAFAQDYYQGKTVSLYAGRPPGGGVDSEMRLVAQFLGDNIPGHPRIIALNMPGAGGVVLGNYLYNVAPKDGFTIGMAGRTAFLLSPVESNGNARYDLSKFSWIGSAASSNFILWLRKGCGITTLAQLRETHKTLTIGGSGNGNSDTIIPELLTKYEHFPFKVIRGYPGTADEILAMQRGEIDGMYTSRGSFPSDPVASGLAVPIFQTFPEESNLPLVQDVATNPREKTLLGLFSVVLKVGLALVAPPGVDPKQVEILRAAFMKTVTSKEYIAEATQRGFDAGKPNSGPFIDDYLQKSFANVPADIKAEFLTYAQ
jgi:tripartite-type tricarboxylate transporter receptor subunit TctC